MNNRKIVVCYIWIILLVLIVTVSGICSFNQTHAYEFVNQYGDNIKMWGAGIYAHDSYFKAPIFIGSDFTILIWMVPLAITTLIKVKKKPNIEYDIRGFGVLSLLFYYSASLAFGVSYNYLHLVYIALFGICFFSLSLLLTKLHAIGIQCPKVCTYPLTKGMKVYLLIAGISLIVAWLPDIITSLTKSTSLELIEVYTTEITYVLDMGIISPLMFVTLYLIEHENFMGYVLLRMLFKVCIVVGIMLPIQSVFQLLAGISIPIPALITKVFIFVVLAGFTAFYEHRLKRETQYYIK